MISTHALGTVGCVVSITLCAAAAAQAIQPLPDSATTNVSLRSQEETNWCWAASGQMIMAKLGKAVEQCVEAKNRFTLGCCDTARPANCNQGGWPELDKYGFSAKTTNNLPLTWDELRNQIVTQKAPIAFSWHWNGGGGHMMVVQGYKIINGEKQVSIHDPWPPHIGDTRDIPYDSYVAGGNHTHWNDYYDIANAGGPSGALVTSSPVPASANPQSSPEEKPRVQKNELEFSVALTSSLSVAKKALRTAKDPQAPGAESSAEALGTPFPNLYIGRDELIPNAPGGKLGVDMLRKTTNQVLYSIESAGVVKRGLLVQRTDDHWRVDPGEANTAVTRQLVDMRMKYAAKHNLPITAFHSVSVPALNAYFVAVDVGDRALLIPVQTDRALGVVAGEPQTVSQLLPKLSAAAIAQRNNAPGVR